MALLILLTVACGRARVQQQGQDAPDAGETATDAGQPADAGAEDGGHAGADAGVTYQIARVALHVHSAISHDACDHHATDGGPLASLDQDFLDQPVRLAFQARLRPEQTFPGADALVAQIRQDIARGRAALGAAGIPDAI